MGRWHLTTLTWLTAVMTVVAGTPHWTCICPDVRQPSSPSADVSQPCRCCGCGGSCCQASLPSEPVPEQACCGEPQSPKAPGYSNPQTPCKRVVAPQILALARTEKTPGKARAADLCLSFVSIVHPQTALTACGRAPWQIHLVAPPTDLVTLLCHFSL
jgi:hypothetical protein